MRALVLAAFVFAVILVSCNPTTPADSGRLTVIQPPKGHHSFSAATVEFCSEGRGLPTIDMKEAIERSLRRPPAEFAVGDGLVVRCAVIADDARHEEVETIVFTYTLRVQFADRRNDLLAVISIDVIVTLSGGGGVYDFGGIDVAADEIAKFAAANFR